MKILIGFFLGLMLLGLPHAQYNKNLFTQENVYVYDLGNLTKDLQKDYTYEQCARSTAEGQFRDCNFFEMIDTPDTAVRQFITALQSKKISQAALVANKKLLTKFLYPHMLGNMVVANHVVVPFHEGVLGIDTLDQQGGFKFFYIVVRSNKLYKFRMNSWMYYSAIDEVVSDGSGVSQLTIIPKGVDYHQKVTVKIDISYFKASDQGGKGESIYYDTTWMKKYLEGKKPSKELDIWLVAFKSKIKKLFK